MATSEIPQDDVLEVSYKMKLQGSEKTANFGDVGTRIESNGVSPSCQRLKNFFRHIDQMIRTREDETVKTTPPIQQNPT